MWQKVELTSEETKQENAEAVELGGIRVQGIQAVVAEALALPDVPVKLKKRKDNIISRLNDPVNSPSHYTTGGIETIDFIEAKELDYNLGNVVKYITRADKKGRKLEDLKKAQWYLNRAVSNLEKP
jgi:hypothetical protein